MCIRDSLQLRHLAHFQLRSRPGGDEPVLGIPVNKHVQQDVYKRQQELIDQNEALSEADMETFAAMTMEEIAREITESAYDLGEDVEPAVDVTLPARESEPQTRPDTSAGEPGSGTGEAEDAGESAGDGLEHADGADGADGTGGDSTGGNGQGSGGASASGSGNASVPVLPTVTEPSSSEEETQSSAELGIKIDYVDYDDGVLDIVFKSRVKWKKDVYKRQVRQLENPQAEQDEKAENRQKPRRQKPRDRVSQAQRDK